MLARLSFARIYTVTIFTKRLISFAGLADIYTYYLLIALYLYVLRQVGIHLIEEILTFRTFVCIDMIHHSRGGYSEAGMIWRIVVFVNCLIILPMNDLTEREGGKV